MWSGIWYKEKITNGIVKRRSRGKRRASLVFYIDSFFYFLLLLLSVWLFRGPWIILFLLGPDDKMMSSREYICVLRTIKWKTGTCRNFGAPLFSPAAPAFRFYFFRYVFHLFFFFGFHFAPFRSLVRIVSFLISFLFSFGML